MNYSLHLSISTQYVHIHTHRHTHMYVCMYVCMNVCMYICAHAYRVLFYAKCYLHGWRKPRPKMHLFGGSPIWSPAVGGPNNCGISRSSSYAQKSGRSKFHVKTTVFHIGSAWACLKIGTKFLWLWSRNVFFHIFPIQIAINRGIRPQPLP